VIEGNLQESIVDLSVVDLKQKKKFGQR